MKGYKINYRKVELGIGALWPGAQETTVQRASQWHCLTLLLFLTYGLSTATGQCQ